MDIPASQLLQKAESWADETSDPLLSEYTRNAMSASEADLFASDDSSAFVTLTPTSNLGVGLVEMAEKTPGDAAKLWPRVREDLFHRASERGFRKLEIIDRGSRLEQIQGTPGRAVARLVSTGPFSTGQVTSRPYRDTDAPGLLKVINEAFEGHPENGSWSVADINSRTSGPGFDPACLLVRQEASEITGFCWTKVHSDGVGEIYLFAVVPSWRGSGLSKQLLAEGLSHLEERHGCTRVIVYTESGNQAAVELYSGAGFRVDRVDRRLEVDLEG